MFLGLKKNTIREVLQSGLCSSDKNEVFFNKTIRLSSIRPCLFNVVLLKVNKLAIECLRKRQARGGAVKYLMCAKPVEIISLCMRAGTERSELLTMPKRGRKRWQDPAYPCRDCEEVSTSIAAVFKSGFIKGK